MRNYNVSTLGLVPNQGKNNTFYDVIILNRVQKWWEVSDGHFKQNYVLFTVPWNKILNFILLRIEYFFSVSSMLNYSCLLYTVGICALHFGCFMDIFFCSSLGFSVHSSHSLNISEKRPRYIMIGIDRPRDLTKRNKWGNKTSGGLLLSCTTTEKDNFMSCWLQNIISL